MYNGGDPNPQDEKEEEPSQEYIKRLMIAHEKKKAFTREYMRKYRAEHKEEVNAYKRSLYNRKKESKCTDV
jgi:hypothetical protein